MKKTLLLSFIIVFLINAPKAQNSFSFNCPKDTTIDCLQNCLTLTTKVPDVRSYTDDYGVNLTSGPGGCFRPPISPAIPGTSTNLDLDDRYTPIIPMPFDFPFYGIIYAQLVVNTNGIISFDIDNANTGAQWTILAGEGSLPTDVYDKAVIMGAYHDIDIQFPNTSPTKQIKYDVIGTAPHRKWVLSFYKVPCFQNACWNLINNTYQITLYEGLGMVDVHVWGRQICNTWNNGNAMIGMQNYEQDKGIMAPGREAWTNPRWGGANLNESWRFTPKTGPTLFKKVELTDLAGNLVANGDTASDGNNGLNVTFNNVCLNSTTQYVVKTQYYNFQYPFQFPASDSIIYSTDTITVYKASSVPPVDLSTTQAQCGANPNGSITINSPVGPNYEYSIDGGSSYQASPSFSVPAGTYTVTVRDITGTCTRDTTVTISAPTTLSGSAVSTNTTCPEALNGSITVTGGGGTGTYEYAVDNIAAPVFVASNVFTGLSSGDHAVLVRDGAGCIFSFTHTINSDPVFNAFGSSVNATCLGALNGSLTVAVPTTGQAPFTYSIPGGSFATYQSSPTFNGLAGDSTYTVNVKDDFGCVSTFTQSVGYDPGITSTFIVRNASCFGVNNGHIVLNPGGGSAPYFYLIDTGSAPSFVALDTIRNLGAGLYDVTVRDNIGCLFNLDDISVISGTGVNATFTVNPSACATASTGSIIMNTNFSGVSPFEYSVNGSSFQPFVGSIRIDTVKSLAPGNYVLQIRDAVGCIFQSQPLTVNAGPDIQASFVTVPTACAVAITGQIAVTPLTGAGPFSYSLDNAPFVALSDTIRNLDSGFHNIIIRDALGCTTSINPEITLGTGVNATFATVNSACSAASTGRIITTITSGTGPYSYSTNGGVSFTALDTIRNLSEGTYNIIMRDAVGCEFASSATVISDNPGVGASFASINSACTGVSTGKIAITPTIGVSPFSYSLDGGINYFPVDTIRNLAGGTYNIRVRDGLGCAYDAPPVTVGNDAGVAATFTTTNSACAVASTGRIIPAVTSGTAPFEYSINSGTNYFPLDTIRNLAGGSYTVLIRDAVGCQFTSPTVTVNSDNPGVGASFASINSACTGVSTGKIAITPTIGVSPFSYSLDGGINYFPVDTIRNLAGGTYNIRVRDGLGCAYDAPPVTVGNDAGVAATFTTTNSACAVASTGRIIPAVTSGTAPFEYSINSGTNYFPLDTIRNLAGGSYTVLIRDAVGCQFTSPTVTVNSNNPGVGASFASINSACTGVSTGKIAITPTIGVSPFSYSLDGGINYFPVDTIRNLAGGTYNIRVRDGLGCAYDAPPVSVGNDIGVTADFSIVKTACATVATGAIIVDPVTGTPPFVYSIDGGGTYKADSVFRNLAVNAYTIRIRDFVGCIFNSPVQNVGNEPGVLTNASTIQNASCAAIPNGTITVNVTAGIPPFSYAMVSPVPGTAQSVNQFTALFSGSYGISITDSAGCTTTITSIVGNNPKVQIDSLNIIRPACNGLQNGTVTVNVSLGVAPYQYAVDGGSFGTSKVLGSLGAGVHRITVKDANDCSIDSVITITEPDILTASVVSTQEATCSGNPDGKIVAAAGGGTPPYQYTLGQPSVNGGFQPTPSFDVLKGNYTVTVKDDKGCLADVNTTVDSVFTMYLDLGESTTLCSGSTLTLSPNTNPETSEFSYSPPLSLDNSNIKNPVASPTQPTTYTLTAKWGICTLTDDITINILRKPVANAGNDVIICYDTTTELRAFATNLSGTVNYTWSPANLLDTKADSSVVTVRPQDEDTYFVVTVRDEYNCNFAVTDSVLVKMLPPVYAFAGNDTNAVLNKAHQLNAAGAGIGGSYLWEYPPGVTVSDRTIGNPTAVFVPVPGIGEYSPNDTNYYKLSVTATNAAGCKATDTIKINVFVGPTCYVPSAFSPNGDGINDIFRPVNVGLNIEYFRVFNRYGEIVYQTSRFRDGWNGFFKGKEQPAGAYVWVFKGKDSRGRDIVEKGTVMLVR